MTLGGNDLDTMKVSHKEEKPPHHSFLSLGKSAASSTPKGRKSLARSNNAQGMKRASYNGMLNIIGNEISLGFFNAIKKQYQYYS